jgi:hypothetical protein
MACTKIIFGVEQALRELLGRVSEDYGLDYAEMEQRYFKVDAEDVFPESIASSPPKTVAPATVRSKPAAKEEAALCAGRTTKGAPCKKRALAGGCFCSVHAAPKEAGDAAAAADGAPKKKRAASSKKKEEPVRALAEEETDESASPPPPPAAAPSAPKKAKRAAAGAKKSKEPPAVHDHPVDEGDHHSDCEGCAVHGRLEDDPVDTDAEHEEYEVRGSVRTRMMEMLSRVAAMEDEVVEEDE